MPMTLNNRGLSLLELIITIALVGVALVFLFELLVDLRRETDNSDFAYNNDVIKSEIIYTIQKDFLNNQLVRISDKSAERNRPLAITFVFKGGMWTHIELNDSSGIYKLYYTDTTGKIFRWDFVDAIFDPCADFIYRKDDNLNAYYFMLKMKIYNSNGNELNNSQNNNPFDDLEITHYFRQSLTDISTLPANGTNRMGTCSST